MAMSMMPDPLHLLVVDLPSRGRDSILQEQAAYSS